MKNFNIGDSVCYEVQEGKNKFFRRGKIIKNYDSYYLIKVTVPAHKNSNEKTRTFIESINKNSDIRAFSYKKGKRTGRSVIRKR